MEMDILPEEIWAWKIENEKSDRMVRKTYFYGIISDSGQSRTGKIVVINLV